MKQNIWILNHYASDDYMDQGGRHYWMAKYLKRMGYNPVIFCCNKIHNKRGFCFKNDKLYTVHKAKEIDVPFVFIKGRDYEGNGKQRILNMIDFFVNVKKTGRLYSQRHGQPDIIYASSVHPLTLVAGIYLAKRFNVKCICEIRDLWPESLVAYKIAKANNPIIIFMRMMEYWIYKKADALVFTMQGAYDYIKRMRWDKKIPSEKVHYINNGVDLELFDKNREQYQIKDPDLEDNNTFKIVYAGSIRKANNLGRLIDIAACIKKERVEFLIWGGGDELEALRNRVQEEHLSNIKFKGMVEKNYIPYIISKADLNIMHDSGAEVLRLYGFSLNKMFEYLAAGKPVISDFSSKYNPIIQYHAGADITDSDVNRMAKAIEDFINLDEEKYNKYCENAIRAAKIFDFSNLTNKVVELIEEL